MNENTANKIAEYSFFSIFRTFDNKYPLVFTFSSFFKDAVIFSKK